MGNIISPTARVTELANQTGSIVLLYECEKHDRNGRLCTPIELKAHSIKEIAASRFLLNQEHGKNPRTIRFKRIDKDDFEKSCTARYIRDHHRIVFSVNKEGQFEMEGVRDPEAGGIFAEFRRTKFVRYLWRPEAAAPQIPAADHPQIPAPRSDQGSESSRSLIPG